MMAFAVGYWVFLSENGGREGKVDDRLLNSLFNAKGKYFGREHATYNLNISCFVVISREQACCIFPFVTTPPLIVLLTCPEAVSRSPLLLRDVLATGLVDSDPHQLLKSTRWALRLQARHAPLKLVVP